MRQGRSSNKLEIKGMEIDKLRKIKEEPHLSGAYIRSLVKQLTSSKTKDSMNNHPKDPDCVVVDDGDGDGFPGQNLTKLGEDLSPNQRSSSSSSNGNSAHQTQQPPQHKKQVRRRLHTTRPYQERLLNMAEARREIVTALKFHRAAMKQASEQQNQQQQQQQQQSPQPPLPQPQMVPCFEQEGKIKSRRNHRVYPSSTANFPNYLENLSYTSNNFSHQHPPPNPFSWPASPIPSHPFCENLNFQLPNQALGLNLNFQDFNNIDTSLYHSSNSNSNNIPSTLYSASSPSSSSSPSISIATDQEFSGSAAMLSQAELVAPMMFSAAADVATTSGGGEGGGGGGGGLHAAMDDEEMAEIRSIGEQHQMEWNDTMNLVTSAWWFKFLKSMELGVPNVKTEDDDDNIDGFHPFDEVMEFPAWLSSNESFFDQHHFDDYYCSDDYFQAPALPCMDIGEIEGMDGDWLA